MQNIRVNFSEKIGKMKPMHAVNNGPIYGFSEDQRITNIDAFREAGIPYARNHDASYCATYGGEHTVDVNFIFPNFDADENDPASYDFAMTDEYIRVCEAADVRTYYRLGSKIEHGVKKYGTLPPKDFSKWARICEHIIRHYTEGWADGFRYDIEYWEIWNEADLDKDDSPNKRCWGGTKAQFFELFAITATHLKKCFPKLKIGGPACCGNLHWLRELLTYLSERKISIDFCSWHRYAWDPEFIREETREVRAMLDETGFEKTENILNEWNYVKGWSGDAWLQSLRDEKSLHGAAFIAAVQCIGQYEDIDLLMYYDARPCCMNGMFNTDFVCDKLKGYYPFYAFNQLYMLGAQVSAEGAGDHVYALAAGDGEAGGVILTNFDVEKTGEAKEVTLTLAGLSGKRRAEFYLLDETHDLTLIKSETFGGETVELPITLGADNMLFVKIR